MNPLALRIKTTADLIELELRRLNRWTPTPLAEDKYNDMGAFGCNTMAFEQWIQFILLERIRIIIKENDVFPAESNVAAYAVREMDGDFEADRLIELLQQLDDLINQQDSPEVVETYNTGGPPVLGSIDELPVPSVLYQLAETLPLFEGDELEAQLQTYDVFLKMNYPGRREAIAGILFAAAEKGKSPANRLRVQKAAWSVREGGPAAVQYNHEEAMRKYKEEFGKGYA